MVEFKRVKLKNGLTILHEKRELPVTTVMLAAKYGSAYESEKEKVLDYLKIMGNIQLTTTIDILSPIISKYVTNVYVNIFNDTNEDNVRIDIINKISDFILK